MCLKDYLFAIRNPQEDDGFGVAISSPFIWNEGVQLISGPKVVKKVASHFASDIVRCPCLLQQAMASSAA